MIQRVGGNSFYDSLSDSTKVPKSDKSKSIEIPSVTDYLTSDERLYNERYLHKISHVKIDNDDVVVYCHHVNVTHSDSSISGVTTMIEEQIRIPKEEVKDLIKKLLSEDS